MERSFEGANMLTSSHTDTNPRHPNNSYAPRRPRARDLKMEHGFHQDRRSDTLVSRHPPSLGASVVPKAVYRPASNVRRPPPALVPALRNPLVTKQLHHRPQCAGHAHGQAHATGPAVQLQDARPHRASHLARLEHGLAQPDHHVQHRHHLHDLGHPLPNSQDAAHRPRQGGLRRPLLRQQRRRLRLVRSGRKRAHVRPAQSGAQHHHLRADRQGRTRYVSCLSRETSECH